jgi:cell division protein FtsB
MLFASLQIIAQNSNAENAEDQIKKMQAQIQKLENDNKSLKSEIGVMQSN